MAPVLQCAAFRLAEAPASVLPFTAGTTQTVGGGGGGGGGGGVADVKLAVAARASLIVTTQVAGWPAQSPVHPEKVSPASGVAVRETVAPSRKMALHAPAHAMPPGALATCPFPLVETVRPRVVTSRKAAPLAPLLSLAIIVT